jgi:mannan endo-1,4-beta-mannosidase
MKKRLAYLLAFFTITVVAEAKTPAKPIDKNATRETKTLHKRLLKLLDKGIMLGHQDDLAYGHGWYKEDGRSDVKSVAGDYPAVIGWELGHVEIGAKYNLDSVYFSDMKHYIQQTYRRGGITTLSWHGDNIVTGKTAWDCSPNDQVVAKILPGGEKHEQFLVYLDHVAAFFQDLKDDKGRPIPVVFRMYHEHTGGWFWWGNIQCTPDEYKQLWKMTVGYLRDKKQVHNLLYAYSPASVKNKQEFFGRYPGDDYVDVIGFDSYAFVKDKGIERYTQEMETNLKIITDYASESGKIPTIGETGHEALVAPAYFTQILYPIISKYRVSWVLLWRNAWDPKLPDHYYVPFVGHPAEADFRSFIEQNKILLNNDIK